MPFFPILLAVLLGIASCIQGATNGAFQTRVGLSTALLLNSVVALAVVLLWWLAAGRDTGRESITATPAYLWLGGFYGVLIMACAAWAFPRIGAGPTTVLAVAANLITALALDHFGILASRYAVTPTRLLGALLLLVGAVLVMGPRLTNAG